MQHIWRFMGIGSARPGGGPEKQSRRASTIATTALMCLAVLAGGSAGNAQAAVADDLQNTLTKLNPISGAIGSLIGQAISQGDTAAQHRLEQLNGIIQLAIQQLNVALKERVADIDEKTTKQLSLLNRYIAADLLQFDYLLNHNLSDVDKFLAARIDQINFDVANTICSVALVTVNPQIRVDEVGIVAFKNPGYSSTVYLPGSCLSRGRGAPEVYLSGPGIEPSWRNLWGGMKLDHASASSALIQVEIPNYLIPDSVTPTDFVLNLRIPTGSTFGFTSYNTQSLPLHICGRLPRLRAHFRVDAAGKEYVRKTVPYPTPYNGLIVDRGIVQAHSSTPSGNGNNTVNVPIPLSPESGWNIDTAPPDYGVTANVLVSHGHYDFGRLPNHDVHIYTDGSEGDAWFNVALGAKLIQVKDRSLCAPAVEFDIPIDYGSKKSIDIRESIGKAIGTACEEAKAELSPIPHVRVEVVDEDGKTYGSAFLNVNVPATFKRGSTAVVLDSDDHVSVQSGPVCEAGLIPIT